MLPVWGFRCRLCEEIVLLLRLVVLVSFFFWLSLLSQAYEKRD